MKTDVVLIGKALGRRAEEVKPKRRME